MKALVFDTFGTVVDWRSSIAKEVEEVAVGVGAAVDGPTFADAWRAEDGPSMNRVDMSGLPWTTLDRLHRESLDRLLPEFGLGGPSEPETGAFRPLSPLICEV